MTGASQTAGDRARAAPRTARRTAPPLSASLRPPSVRPPAAHLGLAGGVVAHALAALVRPAHQHLARAEVEGAQVHGAAQVARQLGLAPELLPARAAGRQGSAAAPRAAPPAPAQRPERGGTRPDLERGPGWRFQNIPETAGPVLEKTPAATGCWQPPCGCSVGTRVSGGGGLGSKIPLRFRPGPRRATCRDRAGRQAAPGPGYEALRPTRLPRSPRHHGATAGPAA